jgi:hypothetical protein
MVFAVGQRCSILLPCRGYCQHAIPTMWHTLEATWFPRYILKKADSCLPFHTDDKEWLAREYSDEQVHDMLQDLLDFGREMGRMGEVNAMVFHRNLAAAIEEAKNTTAKLVKFPKKGLRGPRNDKEEGAEKRCSAPS